MGEMKKELALREPGEDDPVFVDPFPLDLVSNSFFISPIVLPQATCRTDALGLSQAARRRFCQPCRACRYLFRA
jgi:hypothetical protein